MLSSTTAASAAAILLVSIASISAVSSNSASLPNIIHILADDLGWAEVGYHNHEAKAIGDVQTPNIDGLAAESLVLDRFYVEKLCSPSRCSVQTGRFGIHVNVQNVVPESHNAEDKDGGYQGIPISMTGVAEKLRDVGYKTHFVGKWDAGMATEAHSPRSRGYDNWLGYWHHSNDYWTQEEEQCRSTAVTDLWRINSTFNGPDLEHRNAPSCTQDNQTASVYAQCVYEEDIFVTEVKRIINEHPVEDPLFLFYSMHLVHMPLQAKEAALAEFSFIQNKFRRSMHAMVNTMDTNVGEIVQTLKETGLWETTLLVFHTDNGGEIMTEFCGGNNYPLRGGKFSHFEGGVRGVALAGGGFLPAERKGQVSEGLMSIADWYATYASLAGLTTEEIMDQRAIAAGLPDIDSTNCWPMISGEAASCRSEVVLGDTSALGFNMDGNALVGGLINENYYKILIGPDNLQWVVGQDVLQGPIYPNATLEVPPLLVPKHCDRTPENGCLYNVLTDPTESRNLADSEPDLFYAMLARVDEIQATVYSPDRGVKSPLACQEAVSRGYYWGPFLPTP